jgi:alpha-tubulin suppressor-like RCC1 family protein
MNPLRLALTLGLLMLAGAATHAQAQLALGQAHTCALMADASVRCWGDGASGQTGAGSADALGDQPGETIGLEALPLGGPVLQIAAGGYHTCAVREGGGVRCWGEGIDGRLGQGDAQSRGDAPGELEALSDVPIGAPATAVAAGLRHTCALLADGGVRCWGSGTFGQTGAGSTRALGDQPGEIEALDDLPLGRPATALAAGAYHTCALLDDATVRCWGLGSFGQTGAGSKVTLGDEPGEIQSLTPLGLPPVRALTAGFAHTCALLVSGAVTCWGDGFFGQLGTGSTDAVGDEPGELSAAPALAFAGGVRALAAGRDHTCALVGAGDVTCWGDGAFGQTGADAQERLGDQPSERADRLPRIPLPAGADAIGAGATHTCAVLSGGLWCWGSGAQGRLGLESTRTWGDQPGEMSALPAVPLSSDVLPVELARFEGVASGDRVRLAWQTASETSNAGWTVEHAAPAGDAVFFLDTWQPLGWVTGAGTSAEARAYSFTTADLAPGRHRFRLRQRDLDGAETLGPVVEIVVGLSVRGFVSTPTPNPAQDAARTTLHVGADQHVRVRLVDLLGRTLAVVWEGLARAGEPVQIDIDTSRLGAGGYLLRVEGERFSTSAALRVVR